MKSIAQNTIAAILIFLMGLNGGVLDVSCQEAMTELEKLQNLRSINYEKGRHFKNWVDYAHLDGDDILWLSASNLLYTFDGVSINERAAVDQRVNIAMYNMVEILDTIYLFSWDHEAYYYPRKSHEKVIRKSKRNFVPISHAKSKKGEDYISTLDGSILKITANDIDTIFKVPAIAEDSLLAVNKECIAFDHSNPNLLWHYYKNNLFHINILDGSFTRYNLKDLSGLYNLHPIENGIIHANLIHIAENVFFGSHYQGLIKFDTQTEQFSALTPAGPKHNKPDPYHGVLEIYPYNDSLLIIGGALSKIYNLNDEKFYKFKRHSERGFSLINFARIQGTKNTLIVNNFYGGINVINPNFNKFNSNLKFNKDNFQKNTLDSQGQRWEVLGEKLVSLNNDRDTISSVFISEIFGEAISNNLLVDKNDDIWLGSEFGLIFYNPAKQEQRLYKNIDGLSTNNWLKDFAGKLDSNGNVYISSGINESFFHPDSLLNKLNTSVSYVSKTEVLGKTEVRDYGDKSEFVLQPDEDYFTLHYSTKDFGLGPTAKFQYKLDGYDGDWIESNSSFSASYNQVPPGNYTFLLRNISNSVEDAPIVEALKIKVKAKWFESLLFKLLIALLVLGLISIYSRIKQTSRKREMELRSEFDEQFSQLKLEALRSQMNPHFLFNCLNSIDNFILNNDPLKASDYLGKFSKLVRNILDFSKMNTITMAEELEAVSLYIKMEQMRFQDKFNYEINIDPQISQDLKTIPPMILQPYVENAIWHGLLHKETVGLLKISISIEDNKYIMEIDDDGIGRERAKQLKTKNAIRRKSHGMKITEDRINLIGELRGKGGEVTIIDKLDDDGKALGTLVVIKLPILLSD